MAKGARSKGANIFVWIMLVLLIIGLAGFGAGGFGGQMRSIGSVGDREIGVNEYARALQQEIRAFEAQTGQAMGFQQALNLGLDRAVREQLVTLAALDNETMRLGLSVGDDAVRDEVLSIPSFRGLDGSFDRSAYRFALQQAGLTEAEFEAQIRQDTARSLLQGAVVGSVTAPQVFTEELVDYVTERRAFLHLRLTPGDLEAPLPEPDDAALQAYYEANAPQFTQPETRDITYAWVTPDMLLDSVQVDEAALRELYTQRLSEFVQPERRLVERLVFGTPEEAAAAMARIAEDEDAFDIIVEERGLTLEDIDQGDVTQAQLGAAGEAVFALDGPGVAGPFETNLGPAIYRVNAILSAQNIPFEEAQDLLRDDLALDRARRMITDMVSDVDDRLAGGAEIEDLAEETEMELGQISWVATQTDDIAGYASFRAAAAELREGDFPEVMVLEDGGIAALRLDAIRPPTVRPIEEVMQQVIEGWARAETLARLAAQAEEMRAAVDDGATLSGFGYPLQVVEAASRDGFVENLPRPVLAEVFELEEGEARVIPGAEAVHLVQLQRVYQAELAEAEMSGLRDSVTTELTQGLTRDVFDMFSAALQREAGITINDAAVNAVHAQFR